MLKSILPLAIVVSLAGCASYPFEEPADTDYFEAIEVVEDADLPVEIVETVTPLPLPGQLKEIPVPSLAPDRASPAEAIAEGRENAQVEPSLDGYINAVQVYPYTEGALYRLYSAPGQVSDIALQPGEELISISAGDTVRWVVGDTTSGGPNGTRAHVLVKPISSGLSTNLMIATDRRTYHLELESTSGAYMAALSWRYPADELQNLRSRNDRASVRAERTIARGLTLADLNFDYRIEGDRADWRPVRVFDDGRHVFIQMPDDIASMDAPPLFIVGTSGDAQLVNYRVRGQYYIVDRLFARAELRHGERDQTVVRIVRAGQQRAGLFGR
ncbi:MAG: P-type conjugative transfer protein TrbG [Pseudomonadota bacterium]